MSTFSGILNSFSNPVIADALLAQRRKAMQAGQPMAATSSTNPAIDTQALIDQRVGQPQAPQGTPTAEALLADTTHQANVAGVASPDRRIRNQSGQESYGNYAHDILPGPAADQLEDIQRTGPHEQHGFVGHLKGFLKGLALGGVGGSVVGAVDPNIPERAIYQNRLSLAEHRAAQERQRQMQELSAGQDYSQQTGRDLNGNLTEQAKLREQAQAALVHEREISQFNKDREFGLKQDQFDINRQYKQSRIRQFQQKIDQGQTIKIVGHDGNTYVVDKSDPSSAMMVTRADGSAIGSWEEAEEEGRKWRVEYAQNQQNARQDKSLNAAGERQDKSIGAAAARQDKAIGAAGTRQDKDIAAGKYRSKKGGTNIFGLPSDGGTATAQIPATGTPRSLSQADIKAYADVNYGGDVAKARARIASEHPDWNLP